MLHHGNIIVEMAGFFVQVMRILIVGFSWALLVPTPQSSVDFYRSLIMFTMGMTYDWWREVDTAKKENRNVHRWFYAVSVGYSVLFLAVSFSGGLFNISTLGGENMGTMTFFPDTELKFAIPRMYIVISMVGYPLISLVEKMVPAKTRRSEEAAA